MKRTGALILTAFMLLLMIPSVSAEEAKTVLYVATNGYDGASGSEEAPLRSLDGARKKVRSILAEGPTAVEVIFRGGDYRIDSTVTFGKEDSGTEEFPVVYKAYEGETVNFKGSTPLRLDTIAPVTEESVLNRMHPNAKGNVVEVDLAANGISREQIFDNMQKVRTNSVMQNGEPNALYIDGKEQELAHYPNGRSFSRFEAGDNNYSFRYSEDEPSRWVDAKGWWIKGYMAYDYTSTRASVVSLDPSEKQITLINDVLEKVVSTRTRRWQAWNLLEELDIPGEYYVDRERMKLYFWTPHTLKNSSLEFSLLAKTMIHVDSASHITFEGIHFTQTRDDVFRWKSVDTVRVENCRFDYIGGTAINCYGGWSENGYTAAETNKDHWQRQIVDNSYNCTVRNNVFYKLGGSAVLISGGNVDTLTPSNNLIENNLIMRTSQVANFEAQAIELYGVGNVVRKNEIAGMPYQAVYMMGNDHLVEYNEFHNIVQETADAGVIYQGQNMIGRGSQANYNYIHDCQVTVSRGHPWQNAIYWDGAQAGNSAEHNIIYNVPTAFLSNSNPQTNYSYNVAVGCTYQPNRFHERYVEELEPVTMDTTVANYGTIRKLVDNIYNKEIYYQHYPELKAWIDGTPAVKFSRVVQNLIVGGGEDQNPGNTQKHGTWEKYIRVPETDDFVDPANQDFRLKKDSALAQELPDVLNEDFDLNEIGYQNELVFDETTAPFRLLYPKNGQSGVTTLNTQLAWEEAYGGMMYRLVVATDPELNDVVYDKTSELTVATLTNLKANTRYYWKVYASSQGRKHVNTWESDGTVYSFSTALYDELNLLSGESAVKLAEEFVPTILEGDKVGEYSIGTKAKLQSMIDRLKVLNTLPQGAVKRSFYDAKVAQLKNSLTSGSVNRGFIDISDYFKPEYWKTRVADKLTMTDTEAKLIHDWTYRTTEDQSNENSAGTVNNGQMAGSVVYCFDLECSGGPKNDMVTFGQSQEVTQIQWTAANQGYYVISGAWGLDLQRANGSSYDMLTRNDYQIQNNGKHKVKFGVITTNMGSYIVVDIDGRTDLSYADVECILRVPLEFEFTNRDTGSYTNISKQESMTTIEEADALWLKAYYLLAKKICDRYNSTLENQVILKRGSGKIVTRQGVFDCSDAPCIYQNGQMYAAYQATAAAFGLSCRTEGNTVVLSRDGLEIVLTAGSRECSVNGTATALSAAVLEKSGSLMLPLGDLSAILGMNSGFYDTESGLMVIAQSGDFAFQDEQLTVTRSAAMFDELAGLDVGKNVLFSEFQ